MNNTYLKDENLLSLLLLNNMIVPEIQREYVWGKSENKSVLERFLKSIKENCDACENCNLVHKKGDINIGFLYSYKPPYVTIDNERYLDEFLIDGQQRFTTLFLLLAYLSVKEKRIKDFVSIIRFDEEKEEINFDYKVRNLTHRFLIDFVSFLNKDANIDSMENETWYLSDYQTDVTVQAMIKSLHTIAEIFNDDYQYFDYILTAVRFWHFKTEATSQGEELYITMNSRGEKLASNEEQKAEILPQEKLLEWGGKWEEWQDFFWKNRGKNPNADKGFNEFLNCISGLSNYLDNDKNVAPEKIEAYFNALVYLYSLSSHEFDWVKKCAKTIRRIINEDSTKWNADYKDENRATEQRRMVFVWFVLELLKQNEKKESFSNREIRALRFIWIRYNNNNRSVTTLKKIVNCWQSGDFSEIEWHIDEKEKYDYLQISATIDNDFSDREKMIWKIEDHPLNIDGRDLGNVNISHLIDFAANPPIHTLQAIYDKFVDIFPTRECNAKYEKTIKSLLLHYKDEHNSLFWKRVSPWYYENYECSDWRRIIRGVIFRKIFTDIFDVNNKCIIDELLQEKKREFYAENNSVDKIRQLKAREQQLIVYSDLADIWIHGNIAFCNINYLSEEEKRRIFVDEMRIYSLRSNFKQPKSLKELWDDVKNKNIVEELQKILNTFCSTSPSTESQEVSQESLDCH
jgi:hypothetical protein